jgi:uncharacterized protein (TIGR00369 family)
MEHPPFNEFLGTTVESMANGKATVTLELQPHHPNKRGVAHGGVVCSLLDSSLGAAVISSMPKEWWCATIHLTVNFIEGSTGGKLTATGEVVRRGARTAFARGEIRNDAGNILATAEGSWHLWNRKPGSDRPASTPDDHPHVTIAGTGENIRVGKILAIGRNYADHVAEMNAPKAGPPVLFFKPATALVHSGGKIVLPQDAGAVHHEVELVAVIGKRGKEIQEQDALDHVLGFAVGLDMTLRDIQAAAKESGTPWSLAKGFDSSAPISQVALRDEVGDGSGLGIRLAINGEERQSSTTSHMMRSVAELIVFASRTVTLEPGDLLFTGTPAGVGPVQPGDKLEATIDRLPPLTVKVQ